MSYIKRKQYKKENLRIRKLIKSFVRCNIKEPQNVSLENKEISEIKWQIKKRKKLMAAFTEEIKNENELANPNWDILEMYGRMFDHLKREINDLKIEQIEMQDEIEEKDWKLDNLFQYQYVTRL